ncbi:MAG: hypothetical protein AUI36_25755, partial [Cyanobacteria bacterium 13_1_40CM_2_61_4]
MSSCLRVLLGSALLLAFASPSPALTINASDSGWHSSAGNHTASNQDYVAGWVTDTEYHDFFVFDLSTLSVTDTILSATLHVYNPKAGEPNASFTNGYDSPDASETYNLREVLTPAAAVTAPSVLNPVVYTDLGDGTLFGSYAASNADNGAFIDIPLNAAGIASAQTFVGIGSFVLGGQVSTLASTINVDEFVFGHTDPAGFGPYT